ncbi:hypothetical protein GBAR_LOCUS1302 [Geodia barretti]|uniref:Secreted protein n=1 Tax=Geodia barretti TaxID=519541 RepID=A0AA35QVF3_GEOBA|nr:hypothetical protein GBAR_LOCUS1302 [Geodia barretti]
MTGSFCGAVGSLLAASSLSLFNSSMRAPSLGSSVVYCSNAFRKPRKAEIPRLETISINCMTVSVSEADFSCCLDSDSVTHLFPIR